MAQWQNGLIICIPRSNAVLICSAAINKLLTDPKVAASIENYSSIMKDEMVHPLQRAVYHVEYAARHKGASHLR